MYNKEKPKVSIYYDQECAFCKRSVELIVRYGYVRVNIVAPAQSNSVLFAVMQEKDSWVVQNETGHIFTTFQAGVEIARHSPILKYLVPLAKPAFMQRLGEWAYRKIAQNRQHIRLP
jgi:predicted DCC family thiol-disulfide oxidoreductase YuxK